MGPGSDLTSDEPDVVLTEKVKPVAFGVSATVYRQLSLIGRWMEKGKDDEDVKAERARRVESNDRVGLKKILLDLELKNKDVESDDDT